MLGNLSRNLAILAIAVLGVGCGPDLGQCDMAHAVRVIYDAQGMPYHEGQAMVHESCGGGNFCHSAAQAGKSRLGAPAGLDFDVRTQPPGASPLDVQRTQAGAARVGEWARAIWGQVEADLMPPQGAGRTPRARGGWQSAQCLRQELPAIETPEGKRKLRNWLACGAPTLITPTLIVPPVSCQGAGFAAVNAILQSRCSQCHGSAMTSGMFDLEGDDCTAYRKLVGAVSTSLSCATRILLVPGDPAASLLVDKLQPSPDCGVRMPLGGALPQDQIDTIADWVQAGALAPPGCPP
ncbi:MAG: hypothetical protein MJD61_17680 [Proteobacteria bacterium]|nr:hypothetical protein [Pseudomonadota bacterium]